MTDRRGVQLEIARTMTTEGWRQAIATALPPASAAGGPSDIEGSGWDAPKR